MKKADLIINENFNNLNLILQEKPSLSSKVVLGVHKGGSTMLHSFIRVYSEGLRGSSKKFCAYNIPSMLFQGGVTDEEFDDLSTIPKLIIAKKAACFYGWRQIPISFLRFKHRLARLKAVCLIRDPKDCAVSAYYSFLKTHRLPKDQTTKAAQNIIQQRKIWAEKSTDEYVLANIKRFAQELYRVTAFAHPSLRIYKYEDVWLNKRWFFQDIIRHLELPYVESSFENAMNKVDIKPGTDKNEHVRKGSPGDHKEKLTQSTITMIDNDYRSLFDLYGY